MASQLRIYTIKTGLLDEFTLFWRAEIVPLRQGFGFAVDGAWSDAETRTFAWIASHPDFDAAAAAYYASPDRAALSHDPSDYIEHVDLRMVTPVAFGGDGEGHGEGEGEGGGEGEGEGDCEGEGGRA